MYSVKKFPDYEKDAWIEKNRDLIEQMKFEDLSKETLRDSLEQIMADYLYLSNVAKEVEDWKQNFVRFLAHAVNTSEGQIEQTKAREDFHGGRLSMIKEILEWF